MAGKNGCKEDEWMVNMELYRDWLFLEGDIEDGYKVEFDDGGWERVEIPHDWAVRRELKKDMEADERWGFGPQAQGFLDRWGIGWYRKHLVLEGKKEGRERRRRGGKERRREERKRNERRREKRKSPPPAKSANSRTRRRSSSTR